VVDIVSGDRWRAAIDLLSAEITPYSDEALANDHVSPGPGRGYPL
jgi:hypothetical protein